jgi:hypothetical protein
MKSGIIYKGPSRIDGAPIVVLATYSNRNTKTGRSCRRISCSMTRYQPAWKQAKPGADASICGTCPLRGTPTTIRRASKPLAAGAMST